MNSLPPTYAPQPFGVAGLTLDQLASVALIALVGLQFYQFFTRRRG